MPSVRDDIDRLLAELGTAYDPGAYTAERMGPSAFGGISEDPQLRAAQLNALNELLGVSREGFTAADRQALQLAMDDVASEGRRARESIIGGARRRGVGGSGLELASQLAAEQGLASDRWRSGVGVGLAGRQRALEALTQSGQLGGQIRGQDYGVASDRARAADLINQFNVSNANEAARFNIAQRMAAEQMRREGLMGRLNYNLGQSGQRRQMAGNVLSTLGQLGGSLIDAWGRGNSRGGSSRGGVSYGGVGMA